MRSLRRVTRNKKRQDVKTFRPCYEYRTKKVYQVDMYNKSHHSRHFFNSFFILRILSFFPDGFITSEMSPRTLGFRWSRTAYSTDEGDAVGAWVLLQAGQQEGVGRSGRALTPNFRNAELSA